MQMKRKVFMADGGLISGQKYKDRLDAAERAAAAPVRAGPTAMPTPAPKPTVRPPIENSALGMRNVGGVGVIDPPSSRGAASMQQTLLKESGFLRRKEGGPVRGPGGPRDDKIPAMLSNGEYVLPADTVKKVGVAKLERLRRRTHSFGKAGKAMK